MSKFQPFMNLWAILFYFVWTAYPGPLLIFLVDFSISL